MLTCVRSHDENDGASEFDEGRDTKRQRRDTDVGLTSYASLQWINIDVRRANSVPDLKQQQKSSRSIGDQATTYFEDNTVRPLHRHNTAYELLGSTAPMPEQAEEGSALCLATEAVATATMAQSSDSKTLVQSAAQIYGKALAAAQKAMRNPVDAASDETLMTILLFSLYESMTSLEHSTTSWAKHIDGAVAIVRARGMEQLENPRSVLLFRAVRTQMLLNALGQTTPIQDFFSPRGWLNDGDDDNTSAYDLLGAFIAMPDLLNRACSAFDNDDNPDARSKVKALLEDALSAQDRLSTWQGFMPAQWVHHSTSSLTGALDETNAEEADAWPGPIYRYKDLEVLNISNKMRGCQMLCSYIVTETLEWLGTDNCSTDDRYEQAQSNIQTLVNDICYSVPLHLSAQKASNDFGEESKDIEGKHLVTCSGANVLC